MPAPRPADDSAHGSATSRDASRDDGPAARAGMSVAQYDWHVRDMAKNLVHPAALYLVAVVAGATRLLGHPLMREPGTGWWRELGLFAAAFLGAWAVLYSTLLRDSGLRSLTVTVLVPLGVLGALAVWVLFPPGGEMSEKQLAAAALLLVGPAPIGWAVTMLRWRSEKRRAAKLLGEPVS